MSMAWYIPVLIFLARICDVSVGTVRTMIVIAGHRYLAAMLGFLEVVIWVFAAGGAFKYLSEPFAVIGYAGGFACGVLVGMWIEEWLALGYRMVRIISRNEAVELDNVLRAEGFLVTRVRGKGKEGPVEIDFLVVKRRRIPEVQALLVEHDPHAYVTIGRVDQAGNGVRAENRFGRSFLERIVMRK